MDKHSFELCKGIIPSTFVTQAENARISNTKILNQLLEHKKIPDHGLPDPVIEQILTNLAAMDSNNFLGICGAGEREGRVFSSIVGRRHFHITHGIGRSGELTATQPKAAGSSIISHLANRLAHHALKISGGIHVRDCFVVPMATGMTLCLSFLALREIRPLAKYVLWPRIDQKSCFKSMGSAGFVPVIIENILVGDELRTNTLEIRRMINELGAQNILCIHTTTSCFAPRAPDDVPEVSMICKEFDIPHVVNNAYGVQLSKCMHLIEEGARVGRLDLFVQSLDKNFMVPVGGSLLAGYNTDLLRQVSLLYPGRASGTPSLDLLITLLSMGVTGYKKILQERIENFEYLRIELAKVAEMFEERVLSSPNNKISLALSLSTFDRTKYTMLGSMLFIRNVSGARVQSCVVKQQIGDHVFEGFGAHCCAYPCAYLNVAAAVGGRKEETDQIISRLMEVLAKMKESGNSDRYCNNLFNV